MAATYYRVTNSVKVILTRLLKELLDKNPLFDKIPVKNKFTDDERAKVQIVVSDSSASHVKLSLDNHITSWATDILLANIRGEKGNALEWAKENTGYKGQKPAPGIYIVTIDCKNTDETWDFFLDPILDIRRELIIPIDSGGGVFKATLENAPVNVGSETIIGDEIAVFVRDRDYTIDNETGEITFLVPVDSFRIILADYRHLQARQGPFKAEQEMANFDIIPGVVMAFGDRIEEGGKQAIVVLPEPTRAGEIIGGRWNMSFSFTTIAQDTMLAEKLVDYVGTLFYATFFDELVEQGISLSGDHSIGSEAEEQELEIPDEYSFQSSMSLSLQVEWEIFNPKLTELRMINLTSNFDSSPSVIEQEAVRVDRKFVDVMNDVRRMNCDFVEESNEFKGDKLSGIPLSPEAGEARNFGLQLVPFNTAFVPSTSLTKQLSQDIPLRVSDPEQEQLDIDIVDIRIGTRAKPPAEI